MKTLIALSLLLLSQTALAEPINKLDVEYAWQITGEFDDDLGSVKTSSLIFVMGKRKEVILENKPIGYSRIERDSYKDSHVPANALSAVFGWWAGYGETLYVILDKGVLKVYFAEVGEATPIPPDFKLIKTIKL